MQLEKLKLIRQSVINKRLNDRKKGRLKKGELIIEIYRNIGKKFGLLKLEDYSGRYKKNVYCKYLCECGDIVIKNYTEVRRGKVVSCGCLGNKTKYLSLSKGNDTIHKLSVRKFTNSIINNWKILKYIDTEKYLCRCDCGKKKIVDTYSIVNGLSKSCGCLNINSTHGKRNTKIYKTWSDMFQRCYNKNHKSYKHYGKRGINVDIRWKSFESFYEDMSPSLDEHLKKHGSRNTTIERINNDSGYSKENCKWATMKEQANNTRKKRILKCQNAPSPQNS